MLERIKKFLKNEKFLIVLCVSFCVVSVIICKVFRTELLSFMGLVLIYCIWKLNAIQEGKRPRVFKARLLYNVADGYEKGDIVLIKYNRFKRMFVIVNDENKLMISRDEFEFIRQ